MSRRGFHVAFGAVLVGALALRLVCFGGLRGWDDVDYIESARALRAHDYSVGSPFRVRYTLTVPLALVQAWIGEREWMQFLVPLGYSVAHLLLAYAVGKLIGGPAIGLWAMALLAILPLDVMAASDLHADLAGSVFMAAAMYALLRSEAARARRRAWLAGAGALIGLATLAKETAVALLVVVAIRAWWNRREIPPVSHGWLALGLSAVLAADALWLRAITGDPLHRFVGGAVHVSHMMKESPGYGWMLQYPAMLLSPSSGSFGYFAGIFALVAVATVWGVARRQRWIVEVTSWWLPLLLVFNCMPLDRTFTRPLFYHFARTLHPLLIPFVLAAAVWLSRGLDRRRAVRAGVVAGFAAVAAVGVFTLSIDARSYALVARQAAPLIERYPAATPVLADNTSVELLRFLLPRRGDRIARYSPIPDAGGVLLLEDPVFIDVETRAGFDVPREFGAPPPAWQTLAVLPRPARPGVRATLRRVLLPGAWGGDGPAASRAAVLWWIPPTVR